MKEHGHVKYNLKNYNSQFRSHIINYNTDNTDLTYKDTHIINITCICTMIILLFKTNFTKVSIGKYSTSYMVKLIKLRMNPT